MIRKLIRDVDNNEVTRNSSVLSELGIGTNDGITKFTGFPIFDEKITGTAHVGLGSSTQFQGPTACAMHNDFVIKKPTLLFDSTVVIERGKFCLEPQSVYPNWRNIDTSSVHPDRHFRRGPALGDAITRGGKPHVVATWISPRADARYDTQVGDTETSGIAAAVLALLTKENHLLDLPFMVQSMHGQYHADALKGAVALLVSFRLLEQV